MPRVCYPRRMGKPFKFEQPQSVVVRGEGGRFQNAPVTQLTPPEVQQASVAQGRDMSEILKEARLPDFSEATGAIVTPWPESRSTDDGGVPWRGMTSGR